MIDPDTHITENWTIAQLIDRFDGTTFKPSDPNPDHFICDYCATGVAYSSQSRVGQYISDRVLNPEHPIWRSSTKDHPEKQTLIPLATYCEDCATRRLYFPCEGFNEVRLFFTLNADRTMTSPEVTDVSPADDGIPWNPRELSEQITGLPWGENVVVSGKELWGPENMVTVFLSMGGGVDIRELVKWDGSLDPQLLGQARQEYKEFARKMLREGRTRTVFRDHIRDNH